MSEIRLHYFQHVPFEDPAAIFGYAATRGHRIEGTRVYEGRPLPSLDQFDALVVMGGPMSVNDEAQLPWLAPEKQLIREALKAGKKVLGVCLGAQMIAGALGARVYKNSKKEIGFFDIQLTEAGRTHPLTAGLPARFRGFHWHGETFDLPAGAVHLARSEACEHQAFVTGDGLGLGLQFHIESTPGSIDRLIEGCAEELVDGQYIQKAPQMQSQAETRCGQLNGFLFTMLDKFFRIGNR